MTEAGAVFLVRGDALPGRDYEEQQLVKFWDVTLKEDKRITEDNQAGINAVGYRPGLYAKRERRMADFALVCRLGRRIRLVIPQE
jgi:hypothetical protein